MFFFICLAVASSPVNASPRASRPEKRSNIAEEPNSEVQSPPQPAPLKTRSMSVDISVLAFTGSASGEKNDTKDPERKDGANATSPSKFRSVSHSPPRIARRTVLQPQRRGLRLSVTTPPLIPELGCQPIFSNSTVSLTSICLNEEIGNFDEEATDLTLSDESNRPAKQFLNSL